MAGGGNPTVKLLDLEGSAGDGSAPELVGLESEGSPVAEALPGVVGLLRVALAGSPVDEAGGVMVSSDDELSSVELEDGLGRAVL